MPEHSTITDIGWVGFGAMGWPMLARLVAADYTVHVCPRSPQQAARLRDIGAVLHEDLPSVGAAAAAVFSIVPGPAEVAEVWNPVSGLLAGMASGTVGVEMSTIGPTPVADLVAAATAGDVEVIDAPVSGGINGAANGSLAIFAGGTGFALDAVAAPMGELGKVIRTGIAGSGQVMKLVNQALVSANTFGLCLGWALAARNGLDLEQTFEALGGGAADGRLLRLEWPMLLDGDLTSGFAAAHMAKDLRMLGDFCEQSGIDTRIVEDLHRAFRQLADGSPTGTATQALAHEMARTTTAASI